jgi:hypothetical protein
MGVEHFNTGMGEGKDLGIIQPAAGPEPDVLPVNRRRSKPTGPTAEEREQGIVEVETIDQTSAPVGKPTKVKEDKVLAKGGQRAPQTMSTRNIHTALTNVHSGLETTASNARSLRSLHPDHKADVMTASQHLAEAADHMDNGAATGLGTNSPDTPATKQHFSNAIKSLSAAHKLLSNSALGDALARHNIHGDLPEAAHLKSLSGHIQSMRGRGAGGDEGASKSWKVVAAGRENIPTTAFTAEALKRMEELGGKEHILVKKVKAAIAGTPKGGGSIVGQEAYNTASEQGQTRRTRSGMTSGPAINPKKRATGASVRTRISEGSKIGRTPTFGESGGVGKTKGKTPTGLTPDPAKSNPNQNRGGRGGAV